MADGFVDSIPKLREALSDSSLAVFYGKHYGAAKLSYGAEIQYACQLLTTVFEKKIKDKEPLKIRVGGVFDAICLAGSLGLTLSPAHKLCYLIPSGNEIKLETSYLGVQSLYYRRGHLVRLTVELVRNGDVFTQSYTQDGPAFSHQPMIQRGEKEKEILLAYCYAKFQNGEAYFETMSEFDFTRVKGAATKKAGGKTPFTYSAWPGEMWKKAVIRRASKRWPALVSEVDEAILFGEDLEEMIEATSEGMDFEGAARDAEGFITEGHLRSLFAAVEDYYGERAPKAIEGWSDRLSEKYGVSSLTSLKAATHLDLLATDISKRLDAIRDAARTTQRPAVAAAPAEEGDGPESA